MNLSVNFSSPNMYSHYSAKKANTCKTVGFSGRFDPAGAKYFTMEIKTLLYNDNRSVGESLGDARHYLGEYSRLIKDGHTGFHSMFDYIALKYLTAINSAVDFGHPATLRETAVEGLTFIRDNVSFAVKNATRTKGTVYMRQSRQASEELHAKCAFELKNILPKDEADEILEVFKKINKEYSGGTTSGQSFRTNPHKEKFRTHRTEEGKESYWHNFTGGFKDKQYRDKSQTHTNGNNGRGFSQKSPLEKAYETMGIPENISNEELKSHFRREISKLHPDLGGDKEKCQKFNAAYTYIKEARGIK